VNRTLKRFNDHHSVVAYLKSDSCSTRLVLFFLVTDICSDNFLISINDLHKIATCPKAHASIVFLLPKVGSGYMDRTFSPLYCQLLEKLHTSVELLSSCGHGRAEDDLSKPCSHFDEQVHGTLLPNSAEVDQKALSFGTSVSKLHGTCIPTSCDTRCLRRSSKPPSRDFERSTRQEASLFFRNRQNFCCPPAKPGVCLKEIIPLQQGCYPYHLPAVRSSKLCSFSDAAQYFQLKSIGV
jgi:hypothetical protein